MAKVLLAADPKSPQARGPFRPCLEAAGHEVTEVGDGPGVLATMRAAPPEVVVLDTALPGLDGFQVLLRLRREENRPRVPIVVLSALPSLLARHLVDQLGVTEYLSKPVACQALCDAVARALGPHTSLPSRRRTATPTARQASTGDPSRAPFARSSRPANTG